MSYKRGDVVELDGRQGIVLAVEDGKSAPGGPDAGTNPWLHVLVGTQKIWYDSTFKYIRVWKTRYGWAYGLAKFGHCVTYHSMSILGRITR